MKVKHKHLLYELHIDEDTQLKEYTVVVDICEPDGTIKLIKVGGIHCKTKEEAYDLGISTAKTTIEDDLKTILRYEFLSTIDNFQKQNKLPEYFVCLPNSTVMFIFNDGLIQSSTLKLFLNFTESINAHLQIKADNDKICILLTKII